MTLGEILDFEELSADCAEDGVYEFFFCAPPIKFLRAVGSPINPWRSVVGGGAPKRTPRGRTPARDRCRRGHAVLDGPGARPSQTPPSSR